MIEPYLPYGLLALQAAAASTVDGAIVDIAFPSHELMQRKFGCSEELVECIIRTTELRGYDAYGLSTVCNSFSHSLGIARQLRTLFPTSHIFMGGPFVTKLSKRVLEEFDFLDAVFVGESETSFATFLTKSISEGDPFRGIRGVHTRYAELVPETPIDNLDSLPRITLAKDYFRWLRLVRSYIPEGGAAPLEATRGCPLQCSFCSTKQVWGPKVRRKSARRLVADMDDISTITGDSFFSLIGDNLGAPRMEFMEFCEQMKEHNKEYTWGCSLKLNLIKSQHLQKMWDAGCRTMFVGVESASQDTLNKVNKAVNVASEIASIKTAISMGFEVETSFIIGFPWETAQDIKDTYNLHCELLRLGANRSQVGVLCPIPGTEIVSGYEVEYDGWRSYVAEDDIPLSEEQSELITRMPDLFAHLGYYPTPYLSRVEIKAIRHASEQIAALHMRSKSARKRILPLAIQSKAHEKSSSLVAK
jgi:radical SAM superfamily enzyme YgiQ (UPF0313 family)